MFFVAKICKRALRASIEGYLAVAASTPTYSSLFWMNKFYEWICLPYYWMNKFVEWIFLPHYWMNNWMNKKLRHSKEICINCEEKKRITCKECVIGELKGIHLIMDRQKNLTPRLWGDWEERRDPISRCCIIPAWFGWYH